MESELISSGHKHTKSGSIGSDATVYFPQPLSKETLFESQSSSIIGSYSDLSPVFVHSSFRTSSTWLWKKLRDAPNTIAYCEIFNEAIETLTHDRLVSNTHEAWRSKHPASAPYFLEFLPLLSASGGVPNYTAKMSFESFIPVDGINGHLNLEEQNYLNFLIQHAQNRHRIPVLTGVRTLGRSKAIQKAFPGKSVFLHRNLFHQWASYSSLAASGNYYFIHTIQQIVSSSQHDPFMRMLYEWFKDRQKIDDERCFQYFLLLHLYLYMHTFDAADVIVDVTAIAQDAELRRMTEVELSNLISHDIDLSDVKIDFGQSVFSVRDVNIFIDTIEQFTKLMATQDVSQQSLYFIESMKERALAEWRRHEFFMREFRQAMFTKERIASGNLDECSGNLESVRAERDDLTARLSDVELERSSLQQGLSESTAQRDNQASHLAELSASHERLQQTLTSVTVQRDDLSAQLAALAVTRDDLQKVMTDVSAERDAHAVNLAEATEKYDELQQSLLDLSAQRDDLSARLVEMTATRDVLEQKVADLTDELKNIRASQSKSWRFGSLWSSPR